jgi:hypothetical protein
MKLNNSTAEVARYWAKTATSILFDDSKLISENVSKIKFETNVYDQILRNIIDHNTTDISEAQFQECINLSKN